MEIEVQSDQIRLAAFRRRRKAKSRPKWTEPWPELMSGAIGSAVGWLLSDDSLAQLVRPAIGFVVGVIGWHYVIRPALSFVWAVPEEEHVALWRELDTLKLKNQSLEQRLTDLISPRAELRYEPENSRYGHLKAGDEIRHLVDVVNLSGRPLVGCRLVLEGSDPDEPHVTYPNAALGDRIGNSEGVFVLKPGDRTKATFQVDVLQEFIPTMSLGSPSGPHKMRYLYADRQFDAQTKFFRDENERIVVLRLESDDLTSAVWLRLNVKYTDEGYEVTVV